MNPQWIMYLLGAIAALVWKWQKYCYESKGSGISFWKASKEWFELETTESKASWIVTFAVVWVIGAAYVERLNFDMLFNGALNAIPQHVSIAFLLGAVAEMTAPAIGEWIVGKMEKAVGK